MENEQVVTNDVTDNSDNDNYSADEISKALEEPVETVTENNEQDAPKNEAPKEKVKEQEDNTIKCPDKFKNEDGTPNVQNLLKSYLALEPLVQEKAEWSKEKAELLEVKKQLDSINEMNEKQAQNEGYQSVLDMNQHKELVNLEANEYAKYLQYTDNPEEVRQLLINYINNPSEQLMEDIEIEFPPEVNKRVAIAKDRKQFEFENQSKQMQETQKYTNIEQVISKSVDSNNELFQYEPFKNLFINTLDRFGDKFTYEDAQVLMGAVSDLKKAFMQEFEKKTNTKIQNDETLNKISSMTNTTNSAPEASYSDADISKMSAKELAKVINKLI